MNSGRRSKEGSASPASADGKGEGEDPAMESGAELVTQERRLHTSEEGGGGAAGARGS